MRTTLLISIFLGFTASLSTHALTSAPVGYRALVSRQTTTIAKSGVARTVVEIKSEITGAEGVTGHTNFTIPLDDPDLRFLLLKAQVTTGGQASIVKPIDVLTSKSTGSKAGSRQLVIPFEAVAVGSVVEVTYQLEKVPLVAGVFAGTATIANLGFADSEMQNYISEIPLKVVAQGFDASFELKQDSKDGKYMLSIAPGAAGSSGATVKKTAFAFVSTAESWSQINRALSAKVEATLKAPITPQVAKLIEQAKALRTPAEKIEAVNEGIHAISGNEAECKACVLQSVAALRRLGFSAFVVSSLRRSATFDNDFVGKMLVTPSSNYFNHDLVYAKDSTNKVWWIDPTNPISTPGILSADLLGSLALVLDGKSERAQLLPTTNSEPAILRMNQVMAPKSDNSIEMESTLMANAGASNHLAMAERASGPAATKQTLSQLLNSDPPVTMDYKPSQNSTGTVYKIKSVAVSWVRDNPGVSKQINLSHPVRLRVRAPVPTSGYDFGQAEVIEVNTTIRGQIAVDPIDQECLGRSRWLDFDRRVLSSKTGLEIRDRVAIKERFVDPLQAKSSEFKAIFADAEACASKSGIVISQKAPLEIGRGPAIERMTDADAITLAESQNVSLRDYLLKKRYRYFSNRLEKDAKDLVALAKIAEVLFEMGHVDGEEYNPGYLNSALEYANRGMSAASGFNAPLLGQRAVIYFYLGRTLEAAKDFTLLNEKERNSFDTAFFGYKLNLKLKNLNEAERWLMHAGKVAVRPAQKKQALRMLGLLYSDQGRHADALSKLSINGNDASASAWDIHYMAREYGLLKNYDKAIQFEKKALEKASVEKIELSAAKNGLIAALLAKAKEATEKKAATPAETQAAQVAAEALYEQALALDSNRLQLYLELIDLRLAKYQLTHRPEDYERAKLSLYQAAVLQAKSPEVARRADALKALRKPASPQK